MKFRKPLTINSRTSTLTNCFVQAIIPSVEPSDDEVTTALAILEIKRESMTCAYCGAAASDWDHLYPLVRNRRPTGYISEIGNMVPSCGSCNQSKSGKPWREWIEGSAAKCPRSRSIPDLADRIARLERYEQWGKPEPIPLENFVEIELWQKHWANLDAITEMMQRAQQHARTLSAPIREGVLAREQKIREREYGQPAPSSSSREHSYHE